MEKKKVRIVLDAMGGDFALQSNIAGGISALKETNNRFHIIFVGKENEIKNELKHLKVKDGNFSILNADEVLSMEDSPTDVIKSKKNSSISIGVNCQKENNAEAFVSAGNTGAVMTAGALFLGKIDGVNRPTIGAFIPTEKGFSFLIDAGANVDCKTHHLMEFAIMGSIYTSEMLNVKRPKIGLLNVGEENTKGNEVAIETNKLFSNSDLNFIGNIEGGDVLRGIVDVIVCDGFIGNILLKFGESIPSFFKFKFKEVAQKNFSKKILIGSLKNTFKQMFKSLDHEEYGGTPLLGVNGVVIIGHGSSSPKAIKNMILKAEDIINKKIVEKIASAIKPSK